MPPYQRNATASELSTPAREFPGVYPMLGELHDRLKKARASTYSILQRLRGPTPENAEGIGKEPSEPCTRELLSRLDREIFGLEDELATISTLVG